MTSATVLMRSGTGNDRSAASRPQWRRIVRVTLLLHRAALISVAVLALAVVVLTVLEEYRAAGPYATYLGAGCLGHPATIACGEDASYLPVQPLQGLSMALRLMPLLVGVFVGAPLVARELESGTFRFAWTQGTRRTRLVAIELTGLAGFLVALAVTLGLVFSGWYAHIFHVVVGPVESPWEPAFFFTSWWLLGAWTVFALVLGTLIGLFVKRTVAAMALAATALVGLIGAAFALLPSMLGIGTAVTSRLSDGALLLGGINRPQQPGDNVPVGSWLVQAWLTDARGRVLDPAQTKQVQYAFASTGHDRDPAGWLQAHHLHYFLAYQPPGHYWVLQGAEGLALLALTALAGLGTVRVMRAKRSRPATIGSGAPR